MVLCLTHATNPQHAKDSEGFASRMTLLHKEIQNKLYRDPGLAPSESPRKKAGGYGSLLMQLFGYLIISQHRPPGKSEAGQVSEASFLSPSVVRHGKSRVANAEKGGRGVDHGRRRDRPHGRGDKKLLRV